MLQAAVSNDFIQINRTDVTMNTSNTFDGCVFLGPKGGFFLTGDPALGAGGTLMDNVTVANHVGMYEFSNGFRWDHSKTTGAEAGLSNSLFFEVRGKAAFNDGSGSVLQIGAAGANMTLNLGSNVTVCSSASNPLSIASGASSTGSITHVEGRFRRNFNEFDPLPEGSTFPDFFAPENYNTAQGGAILPTYENLWDFNLDEGANALAGFNARAVITAAKGTHTRWDAVIADLTAHYHREPDHYASIANSTAVGTAVATGLTDTAFHPRYGGNQEGYFKIISGELRVAKALTGLDRIFVLRGSGNEIFIVDVVA